MSSGKLSVGGRFTTDKKEINQVADVTLTQHPVACREDGLASQRWIYLPLVLSPLGAQIFPNLPFFAALYHFDARITGRRTDLATPLS